MKTILWKGIIYNSLEYFNLTQADNVFVAKSKIVGTYNDNIYSVNYHLIIDSEWLIQNFHITYEVNGMEKMLQGDKIMNKWEINGQIDEDFTDFKFIDISLTPFTNTLPIKNINMPLAQENEIHVIYLDILNGSITPVKQKYIKKNDDMYRFENVPNDFEADIKIDSFGLVEFYPELFQKILEK